MRTPKAARPTGHHDLVERRSAVPEQELTEKEAASQHLRYLAEHLGARPVGSEASSRARTYIVHAVKRAGFTPELQAFSTRRPLYGRPRLLAAGGRSIPCLPVMGSPPTLGRVSAVPRLLTRDAACGQPSEITPGGLGLAPIHAGTEAAALAVAARCGVGAVLFYHEGAPELYSAVVAEAAVSVPCITIRPADAHYLAQRGADVELIVEVERAETIGVNVIVEIGKGWPTGPSSNPRALRRRSAKR